MWMEGRVTVNKIKTVYVTLGTCKCVRITVIVVCLSVHTLVDELLPQSPPKYYDKI